MKSFKRTAAVLAGAALLLAAGSALAQIPVVSVAQDGVGGETYSLSIQVLALMTALTLLPALILSMTAFTRIAIVLAILRQALGTPTTPPNQVLLGLSLFLTMFVMAPVMSQAYEQGIAPYLAGDQDALVAVEHALSPVKILSLD